MHTHTHIKNIFFSAALYVADDGDDGPCETESFHVVEGHEIEVVEPGTT